VAFRLDFLEAIQRKWLSPFTYFGVYDDTDYSQITWLGNRSDEEELLQVQLKGELAEKFLKPGKIKSKQERSVFVLLLDKLTFYQIILIKKAIGLLAFIHNKWRSEESRQSRS
jgi:superfamily II DNA or RNA helicase